MNTTARTDYNGITRLLNKISRYIGKSCFLYISSVCDNDSLSRIELQILERIFTIGFYSDEVIESACFSALNKDVMNVVEFNFLIDEVSSTFYRPYL